MDKSVNEKLLDEQIYWVNNILKEYINEQNPELLYDGSDKKRKEKNQKLSHPFYMGLSKEYLSAEADKRIMIIGQEAGGYGTIDDGTAEYGFIEATEKSKTNAPENSQKWAVAYLQKQLYDMYDELPACYDEIQKNTSPFWEFFRKLNKRYALCWNNLDKVYFGKTLSYTAEEYLSKQYERNGKKQSLLEREIGLANPQAVIFVTGPYYDRSMEVAFGKGGEISKYRPTVDKLITDVSEVLNLCNGVKAFWTYHPMYLNCQATLDEIVDNLKI